MNDVQILFRLPSALLKQIDRTAKRMTLTRSAVVRLLVLKGLDVEKKESEGQP
jgi:metal-responsive CopG/Arc/MetJ family transcriptional regulator